MATRQRQETQQQQRPFIACLALQGRLGNQLFEFARAVDLVERYKGGRPGVIFVRNPHMLDKDLAPVVTKALAAQFDISVVTHMTPNPFHALRDLKIIPVTREDNGFELVLLSAEQQHANEGRFDAVLLDGYRQNYRYFSKTWALFRDALTSAYAWGNLVNRDSLDNCIVMHVRRGDYTKNVRVWNVLPVMPVAYYSHALQEVHTRTQYTKVAVFCEAGDEAAITRDILDPLRQAMPHLQFQFSAQVEKGRPNSALDELMYMSTGSAFVIANSSFSWWAAWLSKVAAEKKVVCVPLQWFGETQTNNNKMELPPLDFGNGAWLACSTRRVVDVSSRRGLNEDDFSILTHRGQHLDVVQMVDIADWDGLKQAEGIRHLRRDFTLADSNWMIVPKCLVIDTSGEPLAPNVVVTHVFRDEAACALHIRNLFASGKSQQVPRWVFYRSDKSISMEHILNDLWFLMRFWWPTGGLFYFKMLAAYSQYLCAVRAESLAKVDSTSPRFKKIEVCLLHPLENDKRNTSVETNW